MSNKYNEPKLSVTQAMVLYLRRLNDWKVARQRDERDWRAYMLISEDAETARRELVKAANRVLRQKRQHINASATLEDVAARLGIAVPAWCYGMLGMDLSRTHQYDDELDAWVPLHIE